MSDEIEYYLSCLEGKKDMITNRISYLLCDVLNYEQKQDTLIVFDMFLIAEASS